VDCYRKIALDRAYWQALGRIAFASRAGRDASLGEEQRASVSVAGSGSPASAVANGTGWSLTVLLAKLQRAIG
jgi:hypothetical protein